MARAGDVTDACVALQQMDLAKIEDNCLQITVPLQYGDFPISLRIPTAIYMIVTGVEVTRVLFDLDNISAMEVCESVNEFYNSDNNLQSVVRLSVDTYLAEILPIAHNICEDYDTIYSYILLNAGGDNVVITERVIRQFILAHLGFSSRSQLCDVIANGIDMSSGRAESDLVNLFQSELLNFIEDFDRCTASADSFLRAFELTNDGGVDGRTFLFQYTGYMTTEAACRDLNRLFRAMICSDDSGDSGESGDSGDSGESGDSGDSGESGDSDKSGPILRGNLVLMMTLNVILWVRYQNI
ncbi:uncharacterized protein [Apostichopus japonicus]|uniref:uncharacterized protein isoform X3 n=1 Tax=Stichopus japonicus TaxID=307972 RepID=UPI003AB75868